MGLFLTMFACKTNSREKVIDSLIDIMKTNGLVLQSREVVNEITGKDNQFEVTDAQNGWVQVFCPETTHSEIAYSLSKKMGIHLFEFHIHEGVFWMYQLFSSGTLKDKFNPVPDYWVKLSKREEKEWAGNSNIISKLFGASKMRIKPYLQFWRNVDKSIKAFPEDRFPVAREWGMLDFQEKLGIKYPEFDKPENIKLTRVVFKESINWVGEPQPAVITSKEDIL